jgi:transcriptional regulator with XRE-family HTH domain
VENGIVVAGGRRLDPEVEAGRALRRLRLARNWSQEEVAVRMTAYGYDFHQTMIAKIEAAQRPLRVRELADFAALYGVEVQDLVYPPTGSLPETDQEIAEITARLDMVQAQAAEARHELAVAREAMHHAEAMYQASAKETAVLEGRLASLLTERQKLIGWESDDDHSLAESSEKTERDALEPTRASISSTAGGPTVLRILLGSQLRRMREARGISAREAGEAIRGSESKISRIELGRNAVREIDIADLLTLYGITDRSEREQLLALASRANQPGWWHKYGDVLPSWFEVYMGLEDAAAQIRIYEVQYVPSLLQTEDYAHAVTTLGRDGVSAREIERKVQLRMARQAMLDRPDPPNLQVVLDEAVLRRHVGGPAMMRDQLKHLAEMAERPNVTIQMLPFQASGCSVEGSFTILRFAEPDLSAMVYLEQLTSALYLDNPEDINSYLRGMRRLTTQALTSSETTQFLRQLLK